MNNRIKKKQSKKKIYSMDLYDINVYFNFSELFEYVTIIKNGIKSKNVNIESLKLCISNIKKQKGIYFNYRAFYLDLKIHEEALLYLRKCLRVKYLKNKKNRL